MNNNVEETLNVPENPFSQERLAGLPGGMTRMGAAIIKGKLDGHAVSSANGHTDEAFSRIKETNLQILSHRWDFFWYCGTPRLSFSRELGRKKAGPFLLTWICYTSIGLLSIAILEWQGPIGFNVI